MKDILILLGTENPNKLYVNRWLYGDGFSKALNAWFTYTFNSNRSILNIDFIGTDLIIGLEEANGVTLEKIPFETNFREPNAEFEYHLDHKVTEATSGVSVAYNSATGISTFTVPYRLRANMNVVGRYLASNETSTFVDAQGNTKTLVSGQVLQLLMQLMVLLLPLQQQVILEIVNLLLVNLMKCTIGLVSKD